MLYGGSPYGGSPYGDKVGAGGPPPPTFKSAWAKQVNRKILMFKKNTAVTGFTVGLISATDGSDITTGTPVGYYTLDGGTQTAIGDVTPVHEGNGQWSFDLTAAEMNGDIVGLTFTHASAITAHFTINTDTKIVSELQDFNAATDDVAVVTLVATTTANTDMRGTDGANTTAPDNAGITANGAAIAALNNLSIAQSKAEADQALVDFFTSVASLVDLIWDEPLSGHNTGGTSGKALKNAAAFIITDGTAQAGAAGQITLASGESATDNLFTHQTLIITGGTGAGQVRIITKYTGSTKVAIVAPNWNVTPDVTSTYEILPGIVHAASSGSTLQEGYAQGGSATTIILSSDASSIDDFYNNQQVIIRSGTGAGQVRIAADYNGTTKVVTLNAAWPGATPDTTSQYIVETDGHAPYMADVILDEPLSGHTVAGSLGQSITDLLAQTVVPQKNVALDNIPVLMVDSTDHVSPKTGLTLTVTRSIDGGAFAAITGSSAEISAGMYQLDASAADMNGDVITFRITGAAADDAFITVHTKP